MQSSPTTYVLKFGKYKNMKIADIININIVDKNGRDKHVGRQYLEWLVEQEWFKHKDIIQSLLDDNPEPEDEFYELEDEEEEEEEEEEVKEVKPRKSSCKEVILNIVQNKVLDFEK